MAGVECVSHVQQSRLVCYRHKSCHSSSTWGTTLICTWWLTLLCDSSTRWRTSLLPELGWLAAPPSRLSQRGAIYKFSECQWIKTKHTHAEFHENSCVVTESLVYHHKYKLHVVLSASSHMTGLNRTYHWRKTFLILRRNEETGHTNELHLHALEWYETATGTYQASPHRDEVSSSRLSSSCNSSHKNTLPSARPCTKAHHFSSLGATSTAF